MEYIDLWRHEYVPTQEYDTSKEDDGTEEQNKTADSKHQYIWIIVIFFILTARFKALSQVVEIWDLHVYVCFHLNVTGQIFIWNGWIVVILSLNYGERYSP